MAKALAAVVFLLLQAGLWAQATAPTISRIDPNTVRAGGPNLEITVSGTGFDSTATVMWRVSPFNVAALATSFVSASQLRAIVPAVLTSQPGAFEIQVRITSEGQSIFSNSLIFGVTGSLAISTSCPLPVAQLGAEYFQTLAAQDGVPPINWSVTGGGLPPGLTLSPSGTVGGIPRQEGTYVFTLRAVDNQGSIATKPCGLTVTREGAPSVALFGITPSGVPARSPTTTIRLDGIGFALGSVAVWNYGGSPQVDLSTTRESAGVLTAVVPATLLLTPATVPIAVRVPSLTASIFTNKVNFSVSPPLEIATVCPLPNGTLGSAYSQLLAARGGFPPYTWSLASGSLPPDLVLDAQGTIAGTPKEAGQFLFTLRVTDSAANSTTAACAVRILGPFRVAPDRLSFTGTSGGPSTLPQLLSVTGVSPGVRFTVRATTADGAGWLQAIATSDRIPALIEVLPDPRRVSPGAYRGTITLTSEESNPSSQTVQVTLTAESPAVGRLAVNPLAVRVSLPRGAPPQERVVLVSNLGNLALDFTAAVADASRWLELSATAGRTSRDAPFALRLRFNPRDLGPGTYRDQVLLRIVGGAEVVPVPVLLAVSTGPEGLGLSQDGLLFQAVAGGPSPPPQAFHPLTSGVSDLFWETSADTDTGGNWLSVTPAAGGSRPGSGGRAEAAVRTDGLGPGQYFGEIRFTAAADNSPRFATAALNVHPPDGDPGPLIHPAALLFQVVPGGPADARTVSVYNVSRVPFRMDSHLEGNPNLWSLSGGSAKTVAPGEAAAIQVRANTLNGPPGLHRASLAIQTSTDSRVRLVDLLMVVAPERACTPSRLVLSSALLPTGFLLPAGLPIPLEVLAWDDCGNPVRSGAAWALAETWQSQVVDLVHTGEGRWAGTWHPQSPGAVPASLRFTAADPARNLQGTLVVNGDLLANDGAPSIFPGGLVSTASYSRFAPVAPGSLVAIFGDALATGQNQARALPLPDRLGQTRVSLAGRDLPLYFAGSTPSFTQVNGMLPYGLLLNTSFQASVRHGDRRSNYEEVFITAAQPGLYSVSQAGSGQGVVVDAANPLVVVDTNNPISLGGVITIYCEGLGAVNQPVVAGQSVPPSPWSETVNPARVTIGGQEAQVLFSGLSPGSTGLYQVNAVVPSTVAPGGVVPIRVTVAGQASNTVTIAVR